MAAIFQLRRGSGSVSLVDGELYVNKGADSLQYAVGEREITLAKLDELNTGSLNLSGDLTASNAYFSNNVKIDGKITVGNETGDTLNIVASLSSSLIPSGSKLFDLGSNTNWYKELYVETISSSFISGSIAGIGNIETFSASVDNRLDIVEITSSLYNNAMSGSLRLYVSPQGSDTNDGTQAHKPFKTIKAAVASLGAINPLIPKRYTVFVGSGNYTEQNPITVPPGVSIVGDNLRTVRLTAANPTKDFFHCHDSNYFYGLRFLDLKHPAFAFSFPASTATATISGGSVSSISIVDSLSGYTDGLNQNLGIVIEGPDTSGSIATATADVVGGVITQINVVSGGNNYAATEKPHISIPAPASQRPVISTSPYIQNCSSITGPFRISNGVKIPVTTPLPYDTSDVDEQGAGGGIRIDGNLVASNSPLESFVADAFTQVNQGGPGHLVINKGYAQFVSCFTTFCTYGFKIANGGFANISNSVIDFGKYGLISKTYYPQTYNTGSSLETKTSTVSGFVIDENGAGYTGSVAGVTITGGGASVQATAQATVNANGSIDEIVLLTSGSGYTSEPSVTIDTPTGGGAIQATTVNNKALISGVSQILISLESGSRGVDISSNMVLNGVDYLVTDVAQVSGQPNRRRVTTYPAPPSIQTNDVVLFYPLSNISTGGMVMEYVGSGVTFNALPKFGGVPIRTREINEIAPGRVFYSTVDNIGNLKIGDFFAVNQLTGEVTIDANAFNLAGLNAIGPFKRNGVAVGVVLQEVSNNTTLLNSQGLYGEDTVPTQYAVHEFVSAFSSSLDGRIDSLEQTSGSLNTFSSSALVRLSNLETTSGSHNGRLSNLESKSASVDISLVELNSYTSSLRTAITASGTNVTINGNLTVKGTTTQIDSTTLNIGDNIIELNYGGSQTISGIYTKDATGALSSGSLLWNSTTDRWIAGVSGSESTILLAGGDGVLSGSTDFSAFSTSVDSRLSNLQTKSASVDVSILNINSITASLSSSVLNLNGATSSLYSSASLMTASIALLTSSVVVLQSFSGNINTRFDNLQTYTTSVNSRFATLATYTGSVDTRLTEIGNVTSSLISSASAVSTSVWNLYQISASQSIQNNNLATYTGSVDTRLTEIGIVSASLILSASAVSSSVWYLNQFSASATNSIVELYWTASDHEGRIDYLETVAGIGGGVSPNIRLSNLELTSASLLTSVSNLNVATASLQTTSASVNTSITNINLFTSSISTASLVTSITNLNSFTSSANIRLNNLETTSASVNISVSNLNNFTASVTTASLVTSITNLNTFTSSANIRLNNLETTTASLNTSVSNLNSFSSSALTRLSALETETSNLESFTSSINTTIKNKLNTDGVLSGSGQLGNYVATITGTSNQVLVAGSGLNNAAVTLSTPQNIDTAATPQFGSLGIGTTASGVSGEIRATGDIVAFYSSDERLKENIKPIENALSKVESVSGNTYDWKAGFENIHSHKGSDIGVIAQEIEKILPQAVIDRENGYKAVDYEKIIPVLIEAIKELSAKIKELENK